MRKHKDEKAAQRRSDLMSSFWPAQLLGNGIYERKNSSLSMTIYANLQR